MADSNAVVEEQPVSKSAAVPEATAPEAPQAKESVPDGTTRLTTTSGVASVIWQRLQERSRAESESWRLSSDSDSIDFILEDRGAGRDESIQAVSARSAAVSRGSGGRDVRGRGPSGPRAQVTAAVLTAEPPASELSLAAVGAVMATRAAQAGESGAAASEGIADKAAAGPCHQSTEGLGDEASDSSTVTDGDELERREEAAGLRRFSGAGQPGSRRESGSSSSGGRGGGG